MKTKDEIQKAHDTLHPIVSAEVDFGYPPGVLQAAHNCLDVLCWVLGHDHSKSFQENLDMISQEAERRGYKLAEENPPPVDPRQMKLFQQ